MSRRFLTLLLLFFAGITLHGETLRFSMRHVHDGNPLRLDALRYETVGSSETFSVSRLAYLLSDFALQSDDGKWTPVPGVAFIDLAKHRTLFGLRDAPAGKYRALRFTVGLVPTQNHADTSTLAADHPLNPNVNGLHWSWNGGYVFLALEGRYRERTTGELSGYVYHFARNPNQATISLPVEVEVAPDGVGADLALTFDIAALLNSPTPLSLIKDGASTHSPKGDPIATALRSNLPGAFQVLSAPRSTEPEVEPVKPLFLPAKFTPFRFQSSRRFPIPPLPRDNPLIEERVTLGEKLFHDTRLSRTNTIACASCHFKEHALSDPRRYSLGVEGLVGTRNAMPLVNLAWKRDGFFWDGRAASLRAQALIPIEDHLEMDQSLEQVTQYLSQQPSYVEAFAKAFAPPEISPEKIGLAIEAFVLTQTSFDSKFDRSMSGKTTLTPQEQRGFQLFFTENEPRNGTLGADCFHCHGGALFTDHGFHNNGLPPTDDRGLGAITGNPADADKFSTPSLRNVALTAPYMHDGRFKTLEQVVDHYSGPMHRNSTLDPNLAKHPKTGLQLDAEDRAALVAFLRTLTDPKFGRASSN